MSALQELTNSGLAEIAIAEGEESWGAGADMAAENAVLFKNDMVIPKVWLTNALSKILKTDKSKNCGDYISSLTGNKIGGPNEPIKFVVVRTLKKWQAFEIMPNGDKEYAKEYGGIMTLENADWKYEEEIDGKKIKRRQVLTFICILENDLISGNAQPYEIDFSGGSKLGGRKLSTAVKQATSKKYVVDGKNVTLPSSAFLFELNTHEETFAKGDAWVKDVRALGYSNKAAVDLAKDVSDFYEANKDAIEFDERDLVDVETESRPVNNVADAEAASTIV